jgi:hypothetical protein
VRSLHLLSVPSIELQRDGAIALLVCWRFRLARRF